MSRRNNVGANNDRVEEYGHWQNKSAVDINPLDKSNECKNKVVEDHKPIDKSLF